MIPSQWNNIITEFSQPDSLLMMPIEDQY